MLYDIGKIHEFVIIRTGYHQLPNSETSFFNESITTRCNLQTHSKSRPARQPTFDRISMKIFQHTYVILEIPAYGENFVSGSFTRPFSTAEIRFVGRQ